MGWQRFLLVVLLIVSSSRVRAEGVVAATATGTVLDPAGRPVAGAAVELRPIPSGYDAGLRVLDRAGEPPPSSRIQTDAQGRFTLSAPERGLYSLVVRAPGRVAMELAPLALLEPLELEPLELAPLALDTGLTVRVVSAEGQLLPGLWVFASAEQETGRISGWRAEPRKGLTGPDGTVRLPLRAGESLRVSVFAEGFAETVRSGVQSDLSVQLGPSERGREASVRALDSAGQPIAGALLRVGPLAWPVGRTDAGGRARFRVPAGTSTTLRVSTSDGRGAAHELAADAAEAAEAEIRLPLEPLLLTGRVRDAETRAPLAGALVWSPAEPGRAVLTGGDGTYRLTAPDDRSFSLRMEAAGHLGLSARAAEAEIRARRLPAVALFPTVPVLGTVVNAEGKPLAGALIEALAGGAGGDAEAALADRKRSGPDGRFELRRLAGGKLYEVRATQPGFFPATLEMSTPERARPLPPLRLVLAPARPATGTVIDDKNRPLVGVRVVLRRSAAASQPEPGRFRVPSAKERGVGEAWTDAQGRFTLAEPPASEVDVLVAHPGFVPALQRRRQMPPGTGPWDLGKVVLRPGVTLSGRVLDKAGRPVEGAEIHRFDGMAPVERLEISLRHEKPITKTGADGRFTLGELPAGKPIHLFVTAEGSLPATVQGLRPPTANLVIRLQPGARLAGRVVDENDEPVAEAGVRLVWQARLEGRPVGDSVYRDATTDSTGRFEIRDSPAGVVQVTASARGFMEPSPFEWTVPSPPGAELAIRLRRGVVLQGQIKTTRGEPVERALVTVGNAGGRSDADGFYRVEGAAPGPAVAELFHPRFRRQQRQVTLEAGGTTLDFELEGGWRISGRVVDEDGAPVSAARVTVETPERNRSYRTYQARSTLDGRFEIDSVAPGPYLAGAEAEGFAPADGTPLTVRDREIEGLELVLRPSATIAGQVLGLDPEQLARVEVSADGEEVSRRGQVDAQGRFVVPDVPAGTWKLSARLASEQREVTVRVVIAPGQTAERDLEFGNRLTLSGRVELAGEPLPEAKVAVRASHLTLERSVTTGFDGEFLIEDLEPDTYWLGVSHRREVLAHNETITLSGDRKMVIRLEAGSLSGKVSDAVTKEPVAALVQLHPVEGTVFTVAGSADETGRFHLPRVSAGRYSLLVKADGYSPAEMTVEVPGNGPGPEVEVTLEAAPGLTLRVALASGAVPSWIDVRAESLGALPAPPASPPSLIAERRQVATDGSVRLSTLPAGTWRLFLGTNGGGMVQLTATVPGPQTAVTFPNAAPLLIQVPALAESSLIGVARLTDSAGTVFATFAPVGQIKTQEPVVGGRATVANVPAGVWNVQVEAPDGRRWNAVTATDGHHEALVRLE
jgi:protocatechuate 3,4-dioxygenase beta subunit